MKPLTGLGYDPDLIRRALGASGRQLRFRFEWLDPTNASKGWLPCVAPGASVENNAMSSIKRTLTCSLVSALDPGFNLASDRIRPAVGILMPDGKWLDFPQGVFLPSGPTRQYRSGSITVPLTCYDQAQVLTDDVVTSRYVVKAGALYTDAITALLTGCPQLNVAPSTLTLPADRVFDPGTTKLAIVNALCASINYGSLWFDGAGVGQVLPYVAPADSLPEYTYSNTGDDALFHPDVDDTLDLFGVPNYIVYSVSQPNRPVLTSVFANNDPTSPVSIPSRGRKIVLSDATIDVATQVELDALVRRAAVNAANVYRTVSFQTPLIPLHENRDTLTVTHDALGLTGAFTETGWKLTMAAGQTMTHSVRQVVNLDSSITGVPDDPQ